MKPRASISSLKRTTFKEYAIRFVFGGIVAVVAGMIGKAYGPVVGGLFLAFPAIFPAAATLIDKRESDKEESAGGDGEVRGIQAAGVDAVGTALGSLGLIAFGAVVYLCSTHLPPAVVLSIALVCWFIVSITAWIIRQRV